MCKKLCDSLALIYCSAVGKIYPRHQIFKTDYQPVKFLHKSLWIFRRNIFTCCTFPLFTAGLEKFDKAYNDGIIKAVLGTNLTYRKPELLEREWYYDVDVSKYTAYFIAAINHDKSVSSIIDPMTKIRTLLDKHGIPMGGEQ